MTTSLVLACFSVLLISMAWCWRGYSHRKLHYDKGWYSGYKYACDQRAKDHPRDRSGKYTKKTN